MLWFIILFFALASCFPVPQPLVDGRGVRFSSGNSRSRAILPPDVNIDLRSEMRANVFDGDGTPTLRQIPLKTWTGSTRKHHLTYRAWRNTGTDKLFNAYLEVQVTGKAGLFVNFGAKSEKGKGDPGLSRVDNGLAVGSGSNPYPRRSSFSMLVGKLHRNVDWSLKGTWRKDFLGTIISSQRINRIPGI